MHPVDVLRRGLHAHEDDRFALPCAPLRLVGVEDDVAARGPRAGGQAPRELSLGSLRVDGGVKELVDAVRVDAEDRLFLGDEALLRHVDGRPHGVRARVRFATEPALEHVELAVLDRELEVLHVAEVMLEGPGDSLELPVGVGHLRLERIVDLPGPYLLTVACRKTDRLRRADAGDNVFALGVGQPLAEELLLSGGRIPCERDARGARVAEIAEDHRQHVARGAPRLGDVVQAPVHEGAVVRPRREDGLDGLPELLARVSRELAPGLRADDGLERGDDGTELIGRDVRIGDAALELLSVDPRAVDSPRGGDAGPGIVEGGIEGRASDAERDRGVHGDEAPVGVEGEARAAGERSKAFHERVVEAEVQDGVHHAGHRRARPGADAHEERSAGVAEARVHRLLEAGKRVFHFSPRLVGESLVARERVADVGSDGEPSRDRQAQRGHLGEARALASQQITPLRIALRPAFPEEEHALGHAIVSPCSGRRCSTSAGSPRLNEAACAGAAFDGGGSCWAPSIPRSATSR